MTRSFRPEDLHAASPAPLTLAAQGFFWTGIEWVETAGGPAIRGQMYVEYWIPAAMAYRTPLVLVHGGGGQGLDMLGTADGRPGWVQHFVRAGHPVYVVDRPGHGRSPHHPDAMGAMGPLPPPAFIERAFTRPEGWPEQYPNAARHDQWPDGGRPGDPAFDAFLAGSGPMMTDLGRHHLDCQRGLVELLERIGPSVVLTHSAGAPTGWLAADARPDLVRALLAVEPVGPPFASRPTGTLSWGLTAAPLSFEPPAASPEEIAREPRAPARPGDLDCLVQAEPARQLPRLAQVPVTVFTAEASWMAHDNHGTVDFLRQAGVGCDHVRLEEHGLHGNGHAMMLEKNSDAVAALIGGWVRDASDPVT